MAVGPVGGVSSAVRCFVCEKVMICYFGMARMTETQPQLFTKCLTFFLPFSGARRERNEYVEADCAGGFARGILTDDLTTHI